MKKVMSLLIMSMLVFVLAACTASNNAGTDQNEGSNNNDNASGEKVLRLNNGSEPTSFDPPIGFDSYSWNALNNLMEGLTRLDDEHLPKEATAEKWDVSEDGKTYTFYIRDNAKWSNGDDVTAGDFVFAWKRLLNPDTASPAAFLGYFIEGAEAYNNGEGSADDVQVKAVDEKTFEVTLVAPQSYFLSVITNPAFFPINEKVAADNPQWFAEAESFVGNGPFSLDEWVHDSHFVMAKNDQYWDADTVNLDKVHWAIVNDSNTEYQMYQAGELDTSGVPADASEALFNEGKVNVGEQAGTYFFRFGVDEEPFQNVNIRKAFAMAVNQQDVVDFVTKRGEEAAKGFVSTGFTDPAGNDFRETNGDLVTFNAEEAKALLEKGMEEEGYETLPEVTLTYNTSDEHKRIAETLQQMFKDNLGVDVKLANMEWNVFLDMQRGLEFQFSRSSFLADYSDPINFLENFQTGHSMNRTGWSNAKYDELIQNALNEADDAKRFDYMYEAEKVLFEEMPIIPLYFYNHVYLQNDAVKGIIRHPVGYIELKWADVE
jgi:dipeptide transport system substrate-binding protein